LASKSGLVRHRGAFPSQQERSCWPWEALHLANKSQCCSARASTVVAEKKRQDARRSPGAVPAVLAVSSHILRSEAVRRVASAVRCVRRGASRHALRRVGAHATLLELSRTRRLGARIGAGGDQKPTLDGRGADDIGAGRSALSARRGRLRAEGSGRTTSRAQGQNGKGRHHCGFHFSTSRGDYAGHADRLPGS
jgi:hypothetical protein